MNKSITILGSITILAMTSIGIINNGYDNANFNVLTNKSTMNENETTLINNQYGYLSNSDWITNQSIVDNKFYSYDTSALKDYTFVNARNTFLVNENGELSYNQDVSIPINEQLNIENTKQQMESNKNITSIKNNDNFYSRSQYDDSYFTGSNSNWQYLQLGGLEKHINISSKQGANKVENSNNLSETLGLYYIAKAVKENKITKTIADDLGQYFLSESSLQTQIKNVDLINNIISIITNNNDIFQLLSKLSLVNNDMNYAVIYVFDDNNQLIKVNYQKFSNINIEKDVNYQFNTWYSGFNSQNEDASSTYTLLKWSDYLKDWDTFARVFSTFRFGNNSHLKTWSNSDEVSSPTLMGETKIIKTYQGSENSNSVFTSSIDSGSWYIGHRIHIQFNIWHDENNIYFKWFLQEDSHWASNLFVEILLKNIIFEI